jgi:O-antigen ligase
MTLSIATIRRSLLEAGRQSVLLCLFSAPLNKPATYIFIALALLCAVLGERLRERFFAACKQPVVIGALIWLLALFLSALHAPAGPERWSALGIGVALLYPLIVAMLLETQQWRTRAMLAFGLSVCIILAISWAQFIGLLPQRELALVDPAYRYTVLHDYTQQGIVCLLLAAMAASFAQTESVRRRKISLWIIVAAAGVNVVFLLQSRTSYLIVVPLLLFWAWRLIGGRQASWRQITLSLTILIACASIALMTPRVQQRLAKAQQDVVQYSGQREANSMGIRLELWKRTLPIIASAPLLGHGLGQWKPEYEAEVKDFANYKDFKMGHPHQEALLILAEQGAVGFALFLTLLVLLARYIGRLRPPQQGFYASLLLIYVTAGLANCLWAVALHRNVFMMLLACIPFCPKPDNTVHPPVAAT